MKIEISTKQRNYPIYIERGVLGRASELISPDGRVFIVSETGIPQEYKDELQRQFPDAPLYNFAQGEQSKNLGTYGDILRWLAENHASRKDMVIALGGGVTGDMAGFAAATYMRGISYVNIPTTTLSQLDSSIGGKTAVDLDGLKNTVGAFWQPSAVLIDPDTLKTLPARQVHSGLAEAVKSGLIRDRELFELFEQGDPETHLEEIIVRSLEVKRRIVEEDETEKSVRKLLNFGHTWGHAYETYYEGRYMHGECVAMGMMTVLKDEDIRGRLGRVLESLELPTGCDADMEEVTRLIMSDKKAAGSTVDIVQVDEIGCGHIETRSMEEIRGWSRV